MESIMRKEYAKSVEKNIQSINIVKQEHVQEVAQGKYVQVKSINFIGLEDVYNMEVEDHHNFSVNGGFIIHNCMDAFRYAVTTDAKAISPIVTLLDRRLLGI